MQSWKDYRNFRKYENADGSFTYTITVDGNVVEVSAEVYEAYAQGGYKMENMEIGFKCDRVLKGPDRKAVRDEHGQAIRLPEREVSLDKLIDEDWDYPSSEPSAEKVALARVEVDALRHALALLENDERVLIEALFFDGLSIREYAEHIGQSKSKVDRQKVKVLGKLKKIMEN